MEKLLLLNKRINKQINSKKATISKIIIRCSGLSIYLNFKFLKEYPDNEVCLYIPSKNSLSVFSLGRNLDIKYTPTIRIIWRINPKMTKFTNKDCQFCIKSRTLNQNIYNSTGIEKYMREYRNLYFKK